ncbi:MAG: DUF421 domain-containing protein [Clostridia bacterium]|nr:DUF421 domain-containing protein [Clostridia bacterium]
MISVIIRTFIIYCVVTIFMRMMGKRQLGELQPGELVITLLISEIATTPIVDNTLPLLNSIIPLMLLVGFEIVTSVIEMKSVRFRYLVDGKPITVIKNGELQQKKLKKLRFTVNDILGALRQKDVFDIEDVQYAVVETNGTLSVLLKPEKRNSTPKNYNIPEKDTGMPCPVIVDGKIIETNFDDCGVSAEEILSKMRFDKLQQKNILLMTVDKDKNYCIITKKEF